MRLRHDGGRESRRPVPTNTTPAASARAPRLVVGRRPSSLTMWKAWRPPLTAASTPNVKATAARMPGRSRGEPKHGEHACNERDRSGERVLGERNTAAGKQEGVIEPVQERHDSGDAEHERLGRARTYGARNAGEQRGAAKRRRHGGCGHGRLSRSGVRGTLSSLPPAPRAAREQSGVPPGVRRALPGAASRTAASRQPARKSSSLTASTHAAPKPNATRSAARSQDCCVVTTASAASHHETLGAAATRRERQSGVRRATVAMDEQEHRYATCHTRREIARDARARPGADREPGRRG